MTLNEYQDLASRTINKDLANFEVRYHALHGIVGEVGELHSLHQKIYQGHAFDFDHAKKELGDILWFLAEYATANGWSLDEIGKENIEKLKKRYPDGFSADRSLHREENDI